ncbi:MAG: hypothetical protein ACRC7Q_03355 [Plesiomonas shigelloides]
MSGVHQRMCLESAPQGRAGAELAGWTRFGKTLTLGYISWLLINPQGIQSMKNSSKLMLASTAGLLLGAVLMWIATSQIIGIRGGLGMAGFVSAAERFAATSEPVRLISCVRLAKQLGYPVDHFAVNARLNSALTPYDNGSQRAFYLLLYLKGYGIGIADSMADKQAAYGELQCQHRLDTMLFKQE